MVGDLATTRSLHRDRVMCLLSIQAGLRVQEMALLTWAMVTDADGQIADAISLQNRASNQPGEDWWPHDADAPGRACGAGHVTDLARGRSGTRSARHFLGAWGWIGAGDRARVGPSALHLAQDGRVFVALGTPDVHHPRRTQRVAGWGEPVGCAGTRRAYQPGDDPTLS
jgi:hypothetical protein